MQKPLYVYAGQSNAAGSWARGVPQDVLKELGQDGVVIVAAKGGTNFQPSHCKEDWYPFNDGDPNTGELFERMLNKIDTALAENADLYLAGVFWIQGEGDSHPYTPRDSYESGLQLIFDTLQSNYGKKFPFVIQQLSENAGFIVTRPQNVEGWRQVMDIQSNLALSNQQIKLLDPDVVALAAGIDPKSMFYDGLHFKDDAYYAFTRAFFREVDVNNKLFEKGHGHIDDKLSYKIKDYDGQYQAGLAKLQYDIPVGTHVTGNFEKLVLVVDDDQLKTNDVNTFSMLDFIF